MAVPLILLYEIGIIIAIIGSKKRGLWIGGGRANEIFLP
jgi:hypothetical protein